MHVLMIVLKIKFASGLKYGFLAILSLMVVRGPAAEARGQQKYGNPQNRNLEVVPQVRLGPVAGPGGSCGGPGRVLRKDRQWTADGPSGDGRRTGEGPAEGPGEVPHGDRGPQGDREGPQGVRDGPSHEGSNVEFTL